VMVIAEMLGIPPERYETFKQWSDTIIAGDNNIPGTPIPPEIISARNSLRDYFTEEIEKRKRRPGPDLVSALVAAHQESEALTAGELLNFVVLLLLAGNETTTNLIGNGMLALGRHPEQMAALRREPALLPGAIEEMLRYDGPVQSTVRHAREALEFGGAQLEGGTFVFVILAAANRDPAHFERPDEFDITRAPVDHLAFGEGIHYCIGAPLARLEGQAAIGMALEKFPELGLKDPAAPVTYKGSFFLRGLSELRMALG
jgi:pimeloyl-[acyl-carrier protein] synthase